MPLPINVNAAMDSGLSVADSPAAIEVLIEAQADPETLAYQLIAARRAQLEDAETLRRVRAL